MYQPDFTACFTKRTFQVETMSAGSSSERQLEEIGSRVRRLRIEKGLSQDRLALEAHVDQSGLSKFERGNRGLGKIPLTRIAGVLGIPLGDLISGTDFQANSSTSG
jgi:DNA-binding XRE family transcriptional regulator